MKHWTDNSVTVTFGEKEKKAIVCNVVKSLEEITLKRLYSPVVYTFTTRWQHGVYKHDDIDVFVYPHEGLGVAALRYIRFSLILSIAGNHQKQNSLISV